MHQVQQLRQFARRRAATVVKACFLNRGKVQLRTVA
jgi:hypothetical protein